VEDRYIPADYTPPTREQLEEVKRILAVKRWEDAFSYTWNGIEIRVPAFKSLSFGAAMKGMTGSPQEQTMLALEELVDPATLELIYLMPAQDFEVFQTAWMKASGVNLGES